MINLFLEYGNKSALVYWLSFATAESIPSEIANYCIGVIANEQHIASEILAMARRVVNEVFDIGDKVGAKILYTDTDDGSGYGRSDGSR